MPKAKKGSKINKPFLDTRSLLLTALLFALTPVLSIVEAALIPVDLIVPGAKIGLGNIPVMFALFFINPLQACLISILKGLFVGMTRGPIAGLLSFTGGVCSVAVMWVLWRLFKDEISWLALSVSGAITHNLAQLLIFSWLNQNITILWYLPLLLAAGVAAGVVTSVLLHLLTPYLERLSLKDISLRASK